MMRIIVLKWLLTEIMLLMWPNEGLIKLIRRVRSERSSDIKVNETTCAMSTEQKLLNKAGGANNQRHVANALARVTIQKNKITPNRDSSFERMFAVWQGFSSIVEGNAEFFLKNSWSVWTKATPFWGKFAVYWGPVMYVSMQPWECQYGVLNYTPLTIFVKM